MRGRENHKKSGMNKISHITDGYKFTEKPTKKFISFIPTACDPLQLGILFFFGHYKNDSIYIDLLSISEVIFKCADKSNENLWTIFK